MWLRTYLLDELCHVVNSYLSEFEQMYFNDRYKPHMYLEASEAQMFYMLNKPILFHAPFVVRACELNSLEVLKRIYGTKLTIDIVNGLKHVDNLKIWKWIYEQCMIHDALTANMRRIFKPDYIRNVEIYEWFNDMGLIRNVRKVVRASVRCGRMELFVYLHNKGFRCRHSDFTYAAARGHLQILEYAYDKGLLRDCSHFMSYALVYFPDAFERLVEKMQVTTLTPHAFAWNNKIDINRKLELYRFVIKRFQYVTTADDIAFFAQHAITFPLTLQSLPVAYYYTLKELKWMESNVTNLLDLINGMNELGNWECLQWYIDHGFTINTNFRLSILALSPTQQDFDTYVNRDVVYNTEWYNRLGQETPFVWMMRYIVREGFDFVTNNALFFLGSEEYHMEAARFLARDTQMLPMSDLHDVQTQNFDMLLNIFSVLRHRIPIVEIFCEFVRDKEQMVPFLNMFPELDLIHPQILKTSNLDVNFYCIT